jgi:hypothetical protein
MRKLPALRNCLLTWQRESSFLGTRATSCCGAEKNILVRELPSRELYLWTTSRQFCGWEKSNNQPHSG